MDLDVVRDMTRRGWDPIGGSERLNCGKLVKHDQATSGQMAN